MAIKSHPTGIRNQERRLGPEMWKITSGQSFAGKATIPSGSAKIDVVFPFISSTDLIFTQAFVQSLGGPASLTTCIVVTSVADAVGFTVGRESGLAAQWDTTIFWYTVRTI